MILNYVILQKNNPLLSSYNIYNSRFMEGYSRSDNMRQLIRDNAHLLPVISRFNIAFGFGETAFRCSRLWII